MGIGRPINGEAFPARFAWLGELKRGKSQRCHEETTRDEHLQLKVFIVPRPFLPVSLMVRAISVAIPHNGFDPRTLGR